MSEALTLEELRDQVWMAMPMAGFDAAFNAAITERDGNRDSLREHMHLLKDAIRERDELTKNSITWMEEAQFLRARAEKAEAELAALKKRIVEMSGHLVRLLEDDDER